MQTGFEQKSEDPEDLILVDSEDRVVGYLDKESCHDGQGLLHRAFSIFLQDEQGRILLQKRSAHKRLWPGYWSNAVCSHPRRSESGPQAATRRLREELNMNSDLRFLYRFEYHAVFEDLGSEHELCEVYWGNCSGLPSANPMEIEELKFVTVADLNESLACEPQLYTPWFQLEWKAIQEHFPDLLKAC